MEKILILGGSGLIGKALINELKPYYDLYATSLKNHIDIPKDKQFIFDVTLSTNIIDIIKKINPKYIISCLQGDFNNQYEQHVRIANYLKDKKKILYFCSTSNVFDADITKAHNELDTTKSISDYGKFKIHCEDTLKSILKENLCILRLPAIWGKNSPRFSQLKSKLKEQKPIDIYTNLLRTNNLDIIIAKQINYLISRNLTGIFHLTSSDIVNYYDFINSIILKLGYNYNNVVINEIRLEVDKYFLALSTVNNIFPKELIVSNEKIINYLTS